MREYVTLNTYVTALTKGKTILANTFTLAIDISTVVTHSITQTQTLLPKSHTHTHFRHHLAHTDHQSAHSDHQHTHTQPSLSRVSRWTTPLGGRRNNNCREVYRVWTINLQTAWCCTAPCLLWWWCGQRRGT